MSTLPRTARPGLPGTAVVTTLLLVLTLPCALRAQGLAGRLVQRGDRSPIGGALVRLLGPDSSEREWTLTGEDGGFHFAAVEAGSYRIEVERIGFETWRSDPVTVPASGALRRTFEVPVRPVELSGIRVQGQARGECRSRDAGGASLAAVWSEVRKALVLTARTADQPGDRFRLRRYDRLLDRELRVQKETASAGTKVGRATYRSTSVEALVDSGFVTQASGGGLEFHAPDAPLLLSDAFGRSHCFRLVAGPDSVKGEVGLAFRPTRDRRVPEIEGALWVDTATARLRALDYRYTNVGEPYPDSLAHGRVRYRALPDGEWVVDRWWIRVPAVVQKRNLPTPAAGQNLVRGTQTEWTVTSWQEMGGDLVKVRMAERTVDTSHDGQIGGTLYDSAGGRPVGHAVVRIEGTGRTTRTDRNGYFLFTGVPAGRYTVVADDVGDRDVTASADVRVAEDGVQLVQLAGPGAQEKVAKAGEREDAGAGERGAAEAAGAAEGGAHENGVGKTGVAAVDSMVEAASRSEASAGAEAIPAGHGELIGTVRAADSGKPLSGASLEVVGTDLAAVTSETGQFRLRAVPSGQVAVTAHYLGYASDTIRVTVQPGALTVTRFRLTTQAVPVAELTVEVQRSIRNPQTRGFYERSRAGSGEFVMRDQIEDHGVLGSLRRMPQVHVNMCRDAGGMTVVGCVNIAVGRAQGQNSTGGRSCTASYYVDGNPMTKQSFSDFIQSLPPEAVEGIEVHEASNVPPQYGGAGIGGCGVVLVWTRKGAEPDSAGSR